ncbi:REP-associated tyrosine transposase [Blastopirellula sediminis]|uniref:REP-associated tyrosine transposase n=1 Tax=Blastopirellula sediminis TaxID=2894196 RepID=UPI0036F30297
MNPPRRKLIKHFHEAGHLHELTFSCFQRMQLLTNDTWRSMLSESIQRAIDRHHYRLIAFVYMPEHIHLLVFPEHDASPIPELLRAIKRPFSYRIKQLLLLHNSPLLQRLTVEQRPGVETFRFWQEGPGYDRNITNPTTTMLSIDYLHENPVKRRLCARAVDWKWSSARRILVPDSPIDRDLPAITKLPADWSTRSH